MIDKKVVVVATGGTIAMKYDKEKHGLVPACSGKDLADAVPGLGDIAPLEFVQFSNIASPGMTPQNMWDLHCKIEELLARDDVAGVVVTHGTDTLEETSFFLDITAKSQKPVVCTAAMRGASDISPDGPYNIYCSVKTAASPQAVGMGVMVCLDEILQAPGEVMKTHSANPATFQSPWWGPIGYVDIDHIVWRRMVLVVKRFHPQALTARVDLIKCMTGSTRDYVDFAVNQGVKGIVIEGFGRGNVPPAMVYGYPGSVTDTRSVGIAAAGEISAAKARLKLMVVLSEHPEYATQRDKLEESFDI